MSLETKIEALTLAIEKLTQVITTDSEHSLKDDVKELMKEVVNEPEFVTEQITEPEPTNTVDHETFKQACLTVARSGKKDEVKAVIESYGVKKSVDVPEEKLAEALAKVEAL